MSGVFVLDVAIVWSHCDPAGIVYFPRFFDMFHETMERWFGAELELPYDKVINGLGLGFPAVHTEADFSRPCRFGDQIAIELRVEHVGTSSIRLGYRIRDAQPGGQPRATGATVCVVMDLDPKRATFGKSVPIPEDLRHRIERFRGSEAS